MALMKLTDIQKLAKDCYEGKVTNYSVDAAQDVLRAEINKIVGGNWNYTNFQKNKWDVYALVQEMVDVNVNRLTREAFSLFTEVSTTALGDIPEYTVKNKNLFKVGIIADGINSTRRQRKLNSKLQVTSFKLAVTIYEDFDKFMTGRIDWVDLVDTVSESFNYELATQIAGTFEAGYNSINANLKQATNAAGVDAELAKIINRVEGATGRKAVVYGSAEAVGNIKGADSITDREDVRNNGQVLKFKGTNVVKLQNAYDENGNKWALRNDMLYIIPEGNKVA